MKARELRRTVLIHARMRVDGAWNDVCIRNISSRGMLLQAANAPKRGTYLEIFRGANTIVGRVVWSKERRFGIHSQDRININAVIQDPVAQAANAKSAPAEQFVERRSDMRRPTVAQLEERAERSRRFATAFQHGMVLVGIGVAVLLLVSIMQDSLARPLKTISESLSAQSE